MPVKFGRQGHSCNFYGGLGPTNESMHHTMIWCSGAHHHDSKLETVLTVWGQLVLHCSARKLCQYKCNARVLPKIYLLGRGESGWCSDVTSTHGAWRHAGVRFLLSGVLVVHQFMRGSLRTFIICVYHCMHHSIMSMLGTKAPSKI